MLRVLDRFSCMLSRASYVVIAGGIDSTKPYTPLIEEPKLYMYMYMEN